MSVEVLLERLRKVRQSSPGKWVACCPAHEDGTPSLSIRECEDGRVLIHCFALCAPEAILSAVELSFLDVMPAKIGSMHSYRQASNRVSASDALGALCHESLVVAIIGADVLEKKEIDVETWERLSAAVERINAARGVAGL